MFSRTELWWQSPDYDEPEDEDIEALGALFEDVEADDEPEFIEREGMTFCGACGLLACPGEEEFDWCDHRTGAGCYHMESSPFNESERED